MLKLTNVYKKKTTIESKGPRFEIGDFLVKLGSVTVGGVFKGVLVEVEYCPCVIVNNCWGILQEFMQEFLGSCVNNIPPQYFNNKGGETFTPVDTIQPATVFSVLESNNKTVTLTSAQTPQGVKGSLP